MIVWVLMIMMPGPGVTVIDNIADADACMATRAQIVREYQEIVREYQGWDMVATCLPIRKVKS